MGCIYTVSFGAEDKYYVGSTINFSLRKRMHISLLRRNMHHSVAMQNAFNKYGEKNYKIEIFEDDIPNEDLLSWEQAVFEIFSFKNRAIPYYNTCQFAGNTNEVKHSIKSRKNMEIGQKNNFIKRATLKIDEIIKYYISEGLFPDYTHPLGKWRYDTLRKKNFNMAKEIAANKGYPHMFDYEILDFELIQNKNIQMIIDFIIEKNYFPRQNSISSEENKLAYTYQNIKNKINSKELFKSSEKLIEESKIPFFWEGSVFYEAFKSIKQIVNFYNLNGYFPRQSSSNDLEKSLASRYVHMYCDNTTINNKLKSNILINNFLRENNCEDFWKMKRNYNPVEKIKQIKEIFETEGIIPSKHHKTRKDLGLFINRQRRYADNFSKKHLFSIDADMYANNNGLQGLLRPQNEIFNQSNKWVPGKGKGFSYQKNWFI